MNINKSLLALALVLSLAAANRANKPRCKWSNDLQKWEAA